jgi:putative pyruvate formate lyase activating enzyme
MDRALHIPLADIRLSLAEEDGINPSLLLCVDGCDVECLFCNRPRRHGPVRELDALTLRRLCRLALESGAMALQLTGGEPLRYGRALAELLARHRQGGRHDSTSFPLVLNTSLLVPRKSVVAVAPLVDRVIAGAKFGNPACAARLSRVPDAFDLYWDNLSAVRGSRVECSLRFLIIPGHLDCCLMPLLERAAKEAPDLLVTLLSGYMPPVECPEAPEILRLLTPDEVERAVMMAKEAFGSAEPPPRGRQIGATCKARPSRPNEAWPRPRRSEAATEQRRRWPEMAGHGLELIIDAEGRICFSTFGPAAIEMTARAFGRREDEPS